VFFVLFFAFFKNVKGGNVKMKKRNSGITLIALVVTIIVLLILAGITISTLMGENGIISNSQNAKTQSVYEEARERMKLAYMAVRSEIATKTAKNGAYDATEDMGHLLYVAAQDLLTDKCYASYDGSVITLTYVDKAIDKGVIGSGKPEKEGWVSGTITVEEQSASFDFDEAAMTRSTQATKGITESTGETGGTEDPDDETETPEVTLSATTGEVEVESTLVLTATLNVTGDIVWSTSDATKATVAGSGENNLTGTVTGVSAGTVTITATYGEVSKTCEVTVKAKEVAGLQPGVKATENTEYENNGIAIIPTGFAIVPGLDDVSQGLVISDVEDDRTNIGNQFVWIPVDEGTYQRNTTYANTNTSAKAYDDTDYLPTGITVPTGKTEVEVETDLVESAGGFYIARFETGKETVNSVDKPVSKYQANVWKSISQTSAKSTAKTFINNNDVKSGLITGIQWDMTMAFISRETRTDGTGTATYDVTQYSSSRHVGSSVEKAGNNIADKVCNIYDLEGNAREYVAEKNSYSPGVPFVTRGGYYRDSNSASSRISNLGIADSYYSYRLALYVKAPEEKVNLISFTIEGYDETFYAEEGMDWQTWCADLEYNTKGAVIVGGSSLFYVFPTVGTTGMLISSSGQQHLTTIIKDGEHYKPGILAGGGSN
jgi:type II secretory pathway pseudopilin PulG